MNLIITEIFQRLWYVDICHLNVRLAVINSHLVLVTVTSRIDIG